jgi:starch synthase
VSALSVALLTREYPPEIYGGAGVHVQHLARALERHVDLAVHCFGASRDLPEVKRAYQPWDALSGSEPHLSALRTLSVDLSMSAGVKGAQLVHSHTWYANLAAHFAKLLYGVPHVMTSHSLEPLRPWKAEQLGGGYALSSFCEKTAIEAADAVVAVSSGMRRDILACYPSVDPERVVVIYNGVDPELFRPDPATDVLKRYGIDTSRPYVAFVGRITRQKGVVHLLEAARYLRPGAQLVLCAGEPDTPEIGAEVEQRVQELERTRGHVVWIFKMLASAELAQILTHARVFVCPSVYEPFGIVNLEAMACGAPVVASKVGGIPEVVEESVTGYLVDPGASDTSKTGEPVDPQAFAQRLAERVNDLLDDAERARRFGEAGRRRVLEHFSWGAIAEQTAALYERLTSG